jgi:hypothetical protein
MARELAADRSADQRVWDEEVQEVTKMVTQGRSGDEICHQEMPWIWAGDKNGHSAVTRNVTLEPAGSTNPAKS